MAVYEKILDQLRDKEFEQEEDCNGINSENVFLKRLYWTLTLPTGDWYDSQAIQLKVIEEENSPLNCMSKLNVCLRRTLGLVSGVKDPYSSIGYRSVCHKSIHFKNSRYRESLMQIAMLCQEL